MRATSPTRVLILAHQTADSAQLFEAVARRASEGECAFTLLVPARPPSLRHVNGPDGSGTAEAQARLEDALPLLSEAAGQDVLGVVGSHEPFAAIQDALNLFGFDEVIISMLPVTLSRWLDLDLPRRVRALGVRVTEVTGAPGRITHVPAA